MIAIIPIVAGIALGLTVRRRTAMLAEAIFYIIAAGVIIATADQHDATTAQGALFALALLPVAAGSLAIGLALRSRRDSSKRLADEVRVDTAGGS